MKQVDLFDGDGETGLLPDEAAPRVYRADPEKVREKMRRILAEARAASVMPWDEETLGYHRTVFPQMSLWLPEEEAAQLRFAFEEEIRRLAAA